MSGDRLIHLSFSPSLLPPLNFYYSISPSLIHPGTRLAFSLIHKITIHEFIEEYDMEKMVLTPSLSGSALMDPSFFILRCPKDKIASSDARLFPLRELW